MAKYIKAKKGNIEVDAKSSEFEELVSLIRASLRQPRKKSTKPEREGEILVEFIKTLTKESIKGFKPEFAGLLGLKESGLNSAIYHRNLTAKHLANILLQLSNTTAEEFISDFFLYLVEKQTRENPPEWLEIFLKIKNLNDEEKKYIAMMGLKFDQMVESRKN